MLEVRVFKFNAKNDILSHTKPHFYMNYDFKNINELLLDIAEADFTFSSQTNGWVKINGVVYSVKDELIPIVNKFKNEISITPLNERGAVKDLTYKNDDFWLVYDKFCQISSLDEYDRSYYSKLEPYFYASITREFIRDFMGDSAFIFAKYLSSKYPQYKKDYISLIDNSENGIWCASSIEKVMPNGYELAQDAIKWAKDIIGTKNNIKVKLDDTVSTGILNISSKFKEFDAVYYGNNCKINGLSIFEIDSKDFPSGFEFLGINDTFAIALASRILFDAYDSGADFLIVDNEMDFYMFDTLSSKCQKFLNRQLDNFYVLRASELVALDGGWEVPSLLSHKLKVLL